MPREINIEYDLWMRLHRTTEQNLPLRRKILLPVGRVLWFSLRINREVERRSNDV